MFFVVIDFRASQHFNRAANVKDKTQRIMNQNWRQKTSATK